MAMQEVPFCFVCLTQVEHDPIFEAPCGHNAGASAVFHPLCLMKFREDRELARKAKAQYVLLLQQVEEDGE